MVPESSKNAWDLPDHLLSWLEEKCNTYIPDNLIQKTILDGNPVPSNVGAPKTMDDYLKEMLIEARKSKEMDKDKTLGKIQRKVMNVFGPLSKIWNEVDLMKSSG